MGESVRAASCRGPEPVSAPELASAPRRAGGLLALSVVIDGRSDAAAAGQVARLAGRLQLAGAWWRQPPLTGPPADDLAALLGLLSAEAAPAIAGLIADARRVGPDLLARMPGADRADRARPVRLAALLPERWFGLLTDVREALSADLAWPAAADAAKAADAGPSAIFVPVSADRELDAAVAGAAKVADGRPVLVEVAVSVGRTTAEASARADGEELFAVIGHPRRQGLFGTLEECQAAAARLVHAGATELVCYLPRSHDLPDVLAQLRAISVGAGVLRPGEPPSSPPPPPAGWGGRRPPAR